jgi:hypothetical protein
MHTHIWMYKTHSMPLNEELFIASKDGNTTKNGYIVLPQ